MGGYAATNWTTVCGALAIGYNWIIGKIEFIGSFRWVRIFQHKVCLALM